MSAGLHAVAPRRGGEPAAARETGPAGAEALARRVLVLLREARRPAATTADGRAVPLLQQDRSRWGQAHIAAALTLLDRAFAAPDVGALTLRAAIECLHVQAPSAQATDWRRIAAVYDLLAEIEPTAEVTRERALAHLRCGARLPTLTQETR